MPRHTSHSNKNCKESRSRSRSSSTESDKHKEKHHKKHHNKKYCLKIESESTRSRSSSSSSSNSNSNSIECYSNKKKCKKHSKKCSKESSKKHSKKCSKNSNKSDDDKSCNMNEIYQYFKNRLLLDDSLMVAGSNAYYSATSTSEQIVTQTYPMNLNNLTLAYNIDTPTLGAPFFVRESGIYIAFFVCSTDSSVQFTFFINGHIQSDTCIGTNSGAGEVVSRHMLTLQKDDSVIIRNYISSIASMKSQIYNGGSLPGNNMSIILLKIASLPNININYLEDKKEVSHKIKKIFKKVTCKLMEDEELMVKGYDVIGTFYNNTSQTVPLESDFVYIMNENVHKLLWNSSSPSNVTIVKDGIYKLFFVTNTNTPAQIAFCVNGVPVDNSIMGSNKGAGQVSIRILLELKKNDVVSVRNHSTAAPNNGIIEVPTNSGGIYQNINAILTIFKIAPIIKAQVIPVECKIEKYFHCYYEIFKHYLLNKHKLQLTGAKSYFSVNSDTTQLVPVNKSFYWSNNIELYNTWHSQGSDKLIIKISGIYDIFVDISTNESVQFALFINGVPDNAFIAGRNSGANRCLMRQFIKLNKDDVITIVNYASIIGNVTTSSNPGGQLVGNNIQIMGFLLCPTYEHCDSDSEEHCKPKPCPPKTSPPKPLKN